MCHFGQRGHADPPIQVRGWDVVRVTWFLGFAHRSFDLSAGEVHLATPIEEFLELLPRDIDDLPLGLISRLFVH